MRTTMINICNYLEKKYGEEMLKVVYEKEANVHYDVYLE
jgi:hypothetical protein